MNNKLNITVPMFLLVVLIGFPQISETIYTPSLPNIAHQLGSTANQVQWTLGIFFFGFAIGVALWGNLSDKIGRRKAMLGGLIIYTIGSFFCANMTSICGLLIFRFVQAFGASVGSVITQSVFRDVFTGKERHQIFSIANIALAICPGLGPLLGGIIVEYLKWRANFILLVGFGVVLFVACFLKLPETSDHLGQKFSVIKLIDVIKRIYSDQRAIGAILLVGIFNGIMFSYYGEAPFIFINIFHMQPSYYGLLGIMMGVAVVVGSLLSYYFNNHFNVNTIIRVGCLVAVIGIFSMFITINRFVPLHLSDVMAGLSIVASMFVFLIGCSMATPSLLSNALMGYDGVVGAASSVLGFSYYILTSVFTLLMGHIHNGTIYQMPLYLVVLAIAIFFVSHSLFIRPAGAN